MPRPLSLFRRAVRIARRRGIRSLLSRLRRRFSFFTHRLVLVLPYRLSHRLDSSEGGDALLTAYLRLLQRLTPLEFRLDDPLSLRDVDPTTITGDSPNQPPIYWGRIDGGDWDLVADRFDDRPVPRSLRLHYEEGVDWEETPLRVYFDEMMERGGAWGYTSPNEFEDRVADIEALVDSVRTNGYLTKAELRATETTEPLPPALDEVTVDVGRNGEYLYRNLGQHRIAVAKLLDLDTIPVRIGTWHPGALETRA
jgi:hypothetical protein